MFFFLCPRRFLARITGMPDWDIEKLVDFAQYSGKYYNVKVMKIANFPMFLQPKSTADSLDAPWISGTLFASAKCLLVSSYLLQQM